MRTILRYLWREYVLGLPATPPPADPLYVDYLLRCALARRGWRVTHLAGGSYCHVEQNARTLDTNHNA